MNTLIIFPKLYICLNKWKPGLYYQHRILPNQILEWHGGYAAWNKHTQYLLKYEYNTVLIAQLSLSAWTVVNIYSGWSSFLLSYFFI